MWPSSLRSFLTSTGLFELKICLPSGSPSMPQGGSSLGSLGAKFFKTIGVPSRLKALVQPICPFVASLAAPGLAHLYPWMGPLIADSRACAPPLSGPLVVVTQACLGLLVAAMAVSRVYTMLCSLPRAPMPRALQWWLAQPCLQV